MRNTSTSLSLGLLLGGFLLSSTAHADDATLFSVVSVATGKCLTQTGEPGLLGDGSFLGTFGGDQRGCDTVSKGDARKRFFVRDAGTGKFVTNINSNSTYVISPEDDPYGLCLDHPWEGTFQFSPCNGSNGQKVKLSEVGSGEYRVDSKLNDLGSCMSAGALLNPNAVEGDLCPWFSTPDDLRWAFMGQGVRSMADVSGVGGDSYFIKQLELAGVSQNDIPNMGVSELAAAVNDPSVVIYRGRVLDNTNGVGFEGFQVCPAGDDGETLLTGFDGRDIACAWTDHDGFYTLVGLPSGTNVLNRIGKKYYIQSALSFATVYNAFFETEFVGTGAIGLARLGLNIDARFPTAAAFNEIDGFGDMSFTVVNELDQLGDPGFGVIEAGDFSGNGAGGVSFTMWADDGSGQFAVPYAGSEGLKYLAPSTNPLFGGSEVPFNGLTETVAGTGGALVFSVPEGEYEVEISDANGSCLPGIDMWPGTVPVRARLTVTEGYLTDVRFVCY